MSAPAQRRPVVLLRPVPGTSPIHRLWAGTKLLAVFGISVLLTFYPGWVPIALVAGLVAVSVWLARIPRGALPTVPRCEARSIWSSAITPPSTSATRVSRISTLMTIMLRVIRSKAVHEDRRGASERASRGSKRSRST